MDEARPPCGVDIDDRFLLESAGLRQIRLRQLQAIESRCTHDAPFHTAIGLVLLSLGDHEQASVYLERALMLEPGHLPAQLAYAQALLAMNDPQAAYELLQQVVCCLPNSGRLKPSQWTEINRQLLLIEDLIKGKPVLPMLLIPRPSQPAGLGWAQRWSLQALAGSETNPLAKTSAGSVTLTIPGVALNDINTITLPVTDQASNRPHAYGQIDVGWTIQGRARSPVFAKPFRADAAWAARARQTPSESDARFEQMEAALEVTQPLSVITPSIEPALVAGAAVTTLRGATGIRLNQAAYQAGVALDDEASCSNRMMLDYRQRRFDSNPVLDGNATAGVWAGQCGASLPSTPAGQWGWLIRLGRDRPLDSSRPGGVQSLMEARINWQTAAWVVDYNTAITKDGGSFSPLLENGARRRQERQTFSVQWRISHERWKAWWGGRHQSPTKPQGEASGLTWLIGGEWSQQRSNLNLFNSNNLGIYIGVKFTK